MKFLVDAHLPRRLAIAIRAAGHDVVHTLDLPDQNRTSDAEINDISVSEQRVVITKDADFVNSFYLQEKPYKLLLISTGNISNALLEALVLPNLIHLVTQLEANSFVELTHTSVVIHK